MNLILQRGKPLHARTRPQRSGIFHRRQGNPEGAADINAILGRQYTAPTRKDRRILDSSLKKSDESKFAILRQNRGHLVKRADRQTDRVVATAPTTVIGVGRPHAGAGHEQATRNTARVIRRSTLTYSGGEAESRPALVRFCKDVMPPSRAPPRSIMLIDANDDRASMSALTKRKFNKFRSPPCRERGYDGLIFIRDCAQFEIETAGHTLVVLANHTQAKVLVRRRPRMRSAKRQAARVATIYRQLRQKHKFIAVIGDFNDTPDSDPIGPLFSQTA